MFWKELVSFKSFSLSDMSRTIGKGNGKVVPVFLTENHAMKAY